MYCLLTCDIQRVLLYYSIIVIFSVLLDASITIYISYCGVRDQSKNSVIKFAKHLNVENVELYLDILHQTKIDSIGGLPFWVNEKMSVADRIILILTPDYLEVNWLFSHFSHKNKEKRFT